MEAEELRKLQKIEAIERLELLQKIYNVHTNVLTEYKQNETIYYSERVNKVYNGILYWLSNEQQYVDAVKEVEKKYNIYVYHCILSHTEFGDLLTMLYVSNDPENWIEEKSKLMVAMPNTFVYDFSGFGSEFGDVQIAGINGGLTRVY